jgi:hypothetical protein
MPLFDFYIMAIGLQQRDDGAAVPIRSGLRMDRELLMFR